MNVGWACVIVLSSFWSDAKIVSWKVVWSVDADNAEPNTSSAVDQSCLVLEKVDSCLAAHLKYSNSKQDMNKAGDASGTIQDVGKYDNNINSLAVIIWLSHMAILALPALFLQHI